MSINAEGDVTGYVAHAPPLFYAHHGRRVVKQSARQMVVGLYAGLIAERLYDPEAPDYHGENDEAEAWNLPREFSIRIPGCAFVGDEVYDQYLERQRQEARRLVFTLRSVIEALADELLKRRSMSGAAVESFVSRRLSGKRDTAFHEAGHAVISYRLGFALGYTTIEPNNAKGTLGVATGADPSPDGSQDADFIVTLFSGFAAERRNNPCADERGAAGDNQRAAELLEGHPELSAAELRQRAEELTTEHWTEIEAVSTALIKDITLEDVEVELICDAIAEGENWREILVAYRRRRPPPPQPEGRSKDES
ncbi:MAG TPA: hypothetical protein VJA21_12070 [Verrucomicrobiae bacterium]